MASRRRARQRALQILFIWDARKQPVEEAMDAYYDALYSEEKLERDPFVATLVRGTVEHLAEVDDRITRHAEHWRLRGSSGRRAAPSCWNAIVSRFTENRES